MGAFCADATSRRARGPEPNAVPRCNRAPTDKRAAGREAKAWRKHESVSKVGGKTAPPESRNVTNRLRRWGVEPGRTELDRGGRRRKTNNCEQGSGKGARTGVGSDAVQGPTNGGRDGAKPQKHVED